VDTLVGNFGDPPAQLNVEIGEIGQFASLQSAQQPR